MKLGLIKCSMTAVLALLVGFNSVQAASFNCSKAQTELEKLICSDRALNKADETLGQIYSRLRKALPKAEANRLKKEQIAWLGFRSDEYDLDGRDRLLIVYQNRIDQLNFRMSPDYKGSVASEAKGDYHIQNYMHLMVRPLSKDRVAILIEGAEPTSAKWVCRFHGNGILKGQYAVIHEEDHPPVIIEFSDGKAEVTSLAESYFCGFGGRLSGEYVNSK